MGSSKLLLPWPTKTNPNGVVIEKVINAWMKSSVTETLIVIRNDDDSALKEICERVPVQIVLANHPADMKASIQTGLQHLIETGAPSPNDRFFVAPADLPTLSARLIDKILDAAGDSPQIAVPKFGDKSGHPVLFPWQFAERIFGLPDDAGINQIVESSHPIEVLFDINERIKDIDTPKEYQAALDKWMSKESL